MKNPQQIAIFRSGEDEYCVAYKDEGFGMYGTKENIVQDLSNRLEQMEGEGYAELGEE